MTDRSFGVATIGQILTPLSDLERVQQVQLRAADLRPLAARQPAPPRACHDASAVGPSRTRLPASVESAPAAAPHRTTMDAKVP